MPDRIDTKPKPLSNCGEVMIGDSPLMEVKGDRELH